MTNTNTKKYSFEDIQTKHNHTMLSNVTKLRKLRLEQTHHCKNET